MIKAIILDVDGIIIGEKIGFNSPHPNNVVIAALKRIRENAVAVCLCTAKPHYAIKEEIQRPNLHNPHIADAGALIIDPIDKIIVEKHVLDKELVSKILERLLAENVYSEIYTVNDYFIQQDQKSEITNQHKHILQKEPVLLVNIVKESSNYEVTKIMPIAKNSKDKNQISNLLKEFESRASISWGVHPVALPLQFGIITAKKSSKKKGAEAIVRSLHISFSEVLGIGDSTSDWQFMSLCGYAATLANGSNELKSLVRSKRDKKFYISNRSVDENGILDIFKYFSL